VRTITAVATSISAFIGKAARGPVNDPVVINSFGDYERRFGGLAKSSMMSYGVRDFYQSGGAQAVIVRISNGATPATIRLPGSGGLDFPLEAANEGAWGNNLRVGVDYNTKEPKNLDQFNLTILETLDGEDVNTEKFFNVSVDPADPLFVARVLEQGSLLVRVPVDSAGDPQIPIDPGTSKPVRPLETLTVVTSSPPKFKLNPIAADANSGSDGGALQPGDYIGDENNKTGIFTFEKTDLFNLMCIPPPDRNLNTDRTVYAAALQYCVKRRAMLIVDPDVEWGSRPETAVEKTTAGFEDMVGQGLSGNAARNAALFVPRIVQVDSLLGNQQTDTFVASGMIAGIMARTDSQRGVWKAPAGLDATLGAVKALQVNLTDDENGQLNPLGVNCLRAFPINGTVVWGARTMRGADQQADEYKYIPVRRTALFLEESLYRGTQWVVFEPNDEPLWAQIRLNVGAFMQNLFRQGAFQGRTPREAYLVKCDSETTTQNDINRGIVNILVGFAPLRPAEFVIIKIQQLAGQIET
jgi:phage tail sheath protein FI